jgi:hypothetical protein
MKRLEDMTEPELRHLLDAIGKRIEQVATSRGVDRPHFALLLFNDPRVAQYVCNCERADVIKAMRECADRLEGRQDVVRAPFGATGDFPDGSIHEHDEGGIRFGIATDPMNQVVLLDFGKPVHSLGMSAGEARQLASKLNEHATRLDGGLGE